MKKRISTLSAALALLCALAACGSEKEPSNNGSIPGSDLMPGDGITDGSGNYPREDDIITPSDPVPGTMPDLDRDETDGGEKTGVPLDQMLRNGRVRDRDGDLLDGENAVTPGADGW